MYKQAGSQGKDGTTADHQVIMKASHFRKCCWTSYCAGMFYGTAARFNILSPIYHWVSMMKLPWFFCLLLWGQLLKGRDEAATSSRHIFNHKQILFLPRLSLVLWGNHQVGSEEKYCFLSRSLALLSLLSPSTCALFIPSCNTITITSAVIKVFSLLLTHLSSESISPHLSLPPCVFFSSLLRSHRHPFCTPLYLITVSQQTSSAYWSP